jgi:DNA-binding transcriptional ArsR family regulator
METMPDNEEQMLAVLTAVANSQRLRVIAALADGRVHVSELARRLGMSRPLLYMHLDKLEKAGLVAGHLELSGDGKAMKYFELAPFELRLTAETIAAVLRAGQPELRAGQPDENGEAGQAASQAMSNEGNQAEGHQAERHQGDDDMKESDR